MRFHQRRFWVKTYMKKHVNYRSKPQGGSSASLLLLVSRQIKEKKKASDKNEGIKEDKQTKMTQNNIEEAKDELM